MLAAVNAKYIHSNMAVYSLKAYVKEFRDQIEIAEYTINQRVDKILADLYERKPDFIAFSCYIWNIRTVLELTADLHRILPGVPIWCGGPEVSYNCGEFLALHEEITGIMSGEGEETFAEIVSAYTAAGRERHKTLGDFLSDVRGIVYRHDGIVKKTGTREPLEMDKIPFYYGREGNFQDRIVYYESSRGCPFSCSYCLSSVERQVRFRDLELVKKELGFFLSQKVMQVKFVDRTFNCSHGRALEIWTYIRDHDNGVTNFHFEIAGDLLNDIEMELLSTLRPGLVQLEIGVQTVNIKALEEVRRRTDLDQLEKNVHKLGRHRNIHRHLDLIAGLPLEDFDSFVHTFNTVIGWKPDQLQLGFLKVLKGSYMREAARRYGLLFGREPPYEVLATRWLSYGELLRLKAVEEMVELYYNSGQFQYALPVMMGGYASPFVFFEDLSAYYRERGYGVVQSSRIVRYQILLAFARQKNENFGDYYAQLLTLDLYARENLKNRPDFCPAGENLKKEAERFYGQENLREILPGYKDCDRKQIRRMTHLEIFDYDFSALLGNRDSGARGCIVLFDYRKRDPLTGNANTIVFPR